MTSIRRHLTYANIVSTIGLFLALGGATAFAARQLAKSSVGARQLKKNAVTSAKIKNGAVRGSDLADGAVTGAKLGDRAVTGAKLADGSVSADKLAPGVLPGPIAGIPVVHRLASATSLEFPPLTADPQVVPLPLEQAAFTQAAGEDDLIVASIDVHIPASCVSPRNAAATLRIDGNQADPRNEFLGRAELDDHKSGDGDLRVQFAPSEISRGIVISAPPAATEHTFSVELRPSSCNGRGGTPSHIVATGVQIDVIGFR